MEGLRLRAGILAQEQSCAQERVFRTPFIAALKVCAPKRGWRDVILLFRHSEDLQAASLARRKPVGVEDGVR